MWGRILTKENINFLKIPLYGLCYVENIDDFNGLKKDELKSLTKEYDESEIIGIVESVDWAIKNPNYDFSSLLPNLQHDNDKIYKYLRKLQVSFK